MDKLIECKLKENLKLEGREIFSQIGILICALEKPLEEEACREIQYHPLKVASAQEIECQSEYSYIKRFCWLIDIGLSAIAVRERVGQSVSERQEGQMTKLLHHSAWIWMKADQRIQQGRLLCFIDREIFDQTRGGVIWQQLPIGKSNKSHISVEHSLKFSSLKLWEYSLVSWSTTAYQRFPDMNPDVKSRLVEDFCWQPTPYSRICNS